MELDKVKEITLSTKRGIIDDADIDENPLLDEMDSYMDELSARLMVTRMVSDSVMKGIVNAIQEEAAEKIALKYGDIDIDIGGGGCGSFVRDFFRSIHDEFEAKICEQESRMNAFSKKWRKRVDDIYSVRQDFADMSESFFSSDLRVLERSSGGKKKDCLGIVMDKPVEVEKPVSEALMSMDKDKLIAHFTREMSEMKRQHDIAVQEKTEELFSIKRYLLKEKGSSPLHFRKEKDFEVMKKKMSELVLKLDVILMENKKLPVVVDGDRDWSRRLKERIYMFFMESRCQPGLLVDERKEASCVPSQVLLKEENIMEEIERLQLAFEEFRVEATIKEENYKSVIKDLVGEVESEREGFQTMTEVIDDNYCTVYEGAIADALANADRILAKLYEEKDSINTELAEKEKALCLQIEENVRLRQKISSLVTTLDGSLQQYHVQISTLNQKLKITADTIQEMKIQKDILERNVREKQEELVAANVKEKDQKNKLESVVVSLIELSKAICDSECKMTQKMQINESKLKVLSQHCSQLKQQSNLLNRKVSWYKERFERRCEDLQKAENEVDLLADEVDTLFDLLQKIYMALDHYSPVLQHYTGVMEILKLIRNEMNRENTKSA